MRRDRMDGPGGYVLMTYGPWTGMLATADKPSSSAIIGGGLVLADVSLPPPSVGEDLSSADVGLSLDERIGAQHDALQRRVGSDAQRELELALESALPVAVREAVLAAQTLPALPEYASWPPEPPAALAALNGTWTDLLLPSLDSRHGDPLAKLRWCLRRIRVVETEAWTVVLCGAGLGWDWEWEHV